MNIDELTSPLDVPTQAVRRDIRKPSEQGLIMRHHGGAGRASSVVNTAFEQREASWTEEKEATMEAMADYTPDGSTVFITIGIIVEQVARALLDYNHLRIITSSLCVAHILYNNPHLEVMVPGGTLRPRNNGVIDPSTSAFVADFRADYLATNVGTTKNDGALLEFDVNEASVVKTMIIHSGHILLTVDHTKCTASAMVETGNVSQVTALFTDEYPGPVLYNLLQSQQVEIAQVSPSQDDALAVQLFPMMAR